jgi:DNA-binding FrmR family transcriptional regulator|tara:strand:+ start:1050 stop:1244 length:195 start_codon:yes stop_codon:yes gene_type:complete
MALRNPETIVRLTDKIQGNLTNLKTMVKTQQPVEDFIKRIENTESVLRDLETQLEREHAALRNG